MAEINETEYLRQQTTDQLVRTLLENQREIERYQELIRYRTTQIEGLQETSSLIHFVLRERDFEEYKATGDIGKHDPLLRLSHMVHDASQEKLDEIVTAALDEIAGRLPPADDGAEIESE